MKKVLVFGATGFVGSQLVPHLIEKKFDVSILTRSSSKMNHVWKDSVNIFEADPTIPGDWMEIIPQHQIIVNLVGENIFAKRWTSKRKENLKQSREATTQNIVSAINEASEQPHAVISVSGTDYYPPDDAKIYKETDQPGTSFLAELCQRWEQPLLSLKENNRFVILRFGASLSTSGKGAERMFKPLKFFVGGTISDGKQWINWLHIDDFIGILLWSIENEHISGVFNAVAPESIRMKNMLHLAGKIMRRPVWTRVPAFALKIVLGERAEMILKGRQVSSTKLVSQGYNFKFPTVTAALEDILKV
ncbi:MAG: TIGR01777 family oxidoreductase [Candidatus Kariarchaeaceae archaeon]|jgi:uncharacterized protein (TIGR01777 family)